ncbi:MAG: imidazole glycerol phosphate synthase subunit HisH [Woeseiaceae bacterium]
MTRVAIINSGGANIASLKFALDRLGTQAELTVDPQRISDASHVILPGVGAAANAMENLRNLNLQDLIPGLTQPVLGICLGMQLLCESSEEDAANCLGILPAQATKLVASAGNPVPNMGWCAVDFSGNHPLLDGISSGEYFYFLHSFVVPPGEFTIATAMHDIKFTAVLAQRNFYATQFHPERSSAAGARLLHNFLQI